MSNWRVRPSAARQFPGHRHSVPLRGLHGIEFFSDLVSELITISQVKEITSHASPTPPTPRPRRFLATSRDWATTQRLCRFLPCPSYNGASRGSLPRRSPAVFSFPFLSHSSLLTKAPVKVTPRPLRSFPLPEAYHCRHFGSVLLHVATRQRESVSPAASSSSVFEKSRWQQPCLPH
jgi:hypothetical protein